MKRLVAAADVHARLPRLIRQSAFPVKSTLNPTHRLTQEGTEERVPLALGATAKPRGRGSGSASYFFRGEPSLRRGNSVCHGSAPDAGPRVACITHQGLSTLPGVSSVARENRVRRGGGRRLWPVHCPGRQRRMTRFSPQPEGTRPVLPISLSLLAPVAGYSSLVAPRTEQNRRPSLPPQVVLTGPRIRIWRR